MATIEEPILGYRIVELKDGNLYSLFHGTQRSRKIPINQWHKADKKLVRNGTGKEYLSGWHFFKTYTNAKKAYDRMFSKKPNRILVQAWFRGNIRLKEHSKRGRCWLADEIKIIRLIHKERIIND